MSSEVCDARRAKVVFGSDAHLLGICSLMRMVWKRIRSATFGPPVECALKDEGLLSRNRQADQDVLGPGLDSGRAIGIVPQGRSV